MGTAPRLLQTTAFVFLGVAVCLQVLGGSRSPGAAGPGVTWAAGSLGLAFAGWSVGRPRHAWPALLLAAACLATARAALPPRHGDSAPELVRVCARVVHSWQEQGGITRLIVDRLPSRAPAERALVRARGLPPPAPGLLLQIHACAELRAGRLELREASWRVLGRLGSGPGLLVRLRAQLRQRLHRVLPPADAGLARALLLGESQAAPTGQRAAYRQLGLLHLLTISGMHFWVWSLLLERLLPGRLVALRWPALLLLAGLADWSAPVLRAGSALALRDLLRRRARAVRGWSLWSLALWLELLRPARLGLSLGLLLSYTATAGLLWASGRSREAGWRRWLIPSAAAGLATTPLLHAHFGTVEPWSIPLTPLFALLLPVRLLGSALALCPGLDSLAGIVLQACRWSEDLLLVPLARLPGTPWMLPQVAPWRILLLVLAGLVALRSRSRPLRALLLSGALLVLAVPQAAPDPRPRRYPVRPGVQLVALPSRAGTVFLSPPGWTGPSGTRLEWEFLPWLCQEGLAPPYWVLGPSWEAAPWLPLAALPQLAPGELLRLGDWRLRDFSQVRDPNTPPAAWLATRAGSGHLVVMRDSLPELRQLRRHLPAAWLDSLTAAVPIRPEHWLWLDAGLRPGQTWPTPATSLSPSGSSSVL